MHTSYRGAWGARNGGASTADAVSANLERGRENAAETHDGTGALSVEDPIKAALVYRLRLFITGMTERSQSAIADLHRICDQRRSGRLELEIIDIFQQPYLAYEDKVIAAPTLLKLAPEPLRRITGDLSDELRLLWALDLVAPD